MLFNPAIYNITQTIVGGGGGGSSLLDSEGSVFMTADEEAFCVDGNDRMVDVTEFPEKPLDNVVYRKNEKKTTSDGQLIYINETTSYGIPVYTDHSNGLHHKNVEVLQYMNDGGDKTQVLINFLGTVIDFMEFYAGTGVLFRGYKVVDSERDVDLSDTKYVYICRLANTIWVYYHANGWGVTEAEQINSLDEASTANGYCVYYGKKDGWQSLSGLAEYETKYYKTMKQWSAIQDGSITELDIDMPKIGDSAFSGCNKLETAKIYTSFIGRSAFNGCSALTTIVTTARTLMEILKWDTYEFRCLVLLSPIVCNNDYHMGVEDILTDDCYRFDGTVDETHNPEGLKDGYIYVPLSLIDKYKAHDKWSSRADQIMPIVKDTNELYKLDTSIYTIAYVASAEMEVKYDGTWKSLR